MLSTQIAPWFGPCIYMYGMDPDKLYLAQGCIIYFQHYLPIAQ